MQILPWTLAELCIASPTEKRNAIPKSCLMGVFLSNFSVHIPNAMSKQWDGEILHDVFSSSVLANSNMSRRQRKVRCVCTNKYILCWLCAQRRQKVRAFPKFQWRPLSALINNNLQIWNSKWQLATHKWRCESWCLPAGWIIVAHLNKKTNNLAKKRKDGQSKNLKIVLTDTLTTPCTEYRQMKHLHLMLEIDKNASTAHAFLSSSVESFQSKLCVSTAGACHHILGWCIYCCWLMDKAAQSGGQQHGN